MIEALGKELAVKGTLHVLRHGLKCYGKTFRRAVQARPRAERRGTRNLRTERASGHLADPVSPGQARPRGLTVGVERTDRGA